MEDGGLMQPLCRLRLACAFRLGRLPFCQFRTHGLRWQSVVMKNRAFLDWAPLPPKRRSHTQSWHRLAHGPVEGHRHGVPPRWCLDLVSFSGGIETSLVVPVAENKMQLRMVLVSR